MFIFPTFQELSSRWRYEVELEGQVYIFEFDWNEREEKWYLNIYTKKDRNEIQMGIKLVIAYGMFRQYLANQLLPKGELYILDLSPTKKKEPITFDNFGQRYVLLYFNEKEIPDAII